MNIIESLNEYKSMSDSVDLIQKALSEANTKLTTDISAYKSIKSVIDKFGYKDGVDLILELSNELIGQVIEDVKLDYSNKINELDSKIAALNTQPETTTIVKEVTEPII